MYRPPQSRAAMPPKKEVAGSICTPARNPRMTTPATTAPSGTATSRAPHAWKDLLALPRDECVGKQVTPGSAQGDVQTGTQDPVRRLHAQRGRVLHDRASEKGGRAKQPPLAPAADQYMFDEDTQALKPFKDGYHRLYFKEELMTRTDTSRGQGRQAGGGGLEPAAARSDGACVGRTAIHAPPTHGDFPYRYLHRTAPLAGQAQGSAPVQDI